MKKFQAVLEVLAVSLKLGLTSFGGPLAHVGYFHTEYVKKRKWIDEPNYLDLVALCQVLPGPASSQLGISLGTFRAGLAGGVAAWLGFTLPSALLMTILALSLGAFNLTSPWIHGLKLVALAVVFQAVLSMGKKLVTTRTLATVALTAMVVVLVLNTGWAQVAVIVAAGAFGAMFGQAGDPGLHSLRAPYSRRGGAACLAVFFVLLIAFPLARALTDNTLVALADGFYRSGALVFGGGHVVLPLLEKEVVGSGLVSKEVFLAGYGAAQAVPGPLFTFAAYLGGAAAGVPGALVALLAIFLPGGLLVIGVLPFWDSLRRRTRLLKSLASVNASVVGILMAALYQPLWTTSVQNPLDLSLAVVLVLILVVWKRPPWLALLVGITASLARGWLGFS